MVFGDAGGGGLGPGGALEDSVGEFITEGILGEKKTFRRAAAVLLGDRADISLGIVAVVVDRALGVGFAGGAGVGVDLLEEQPADRGR